MVNRKLFTVVDHDHALLDPTKPGDRTVTQPIQIAVLDRYDGVVWNVAGTPSGNAEASGLFRAVGETQPPPVQRGPSAHITVKIEDAYDEFWLPTVGHLTDLRFGGPRRRDLTNSWRFNRTTGTGLVQQLLQKGDEIRIESVFDPQLNGIPAASPLGTIDLPPVAPMGPELPKLAKELTKSVERPEKAAALVRAFTGTDHPEFGFSDGNSKQNTSGPGHNVQRMKLFASDYYDFKSTSGNGEQYASAHALMARSLNIPTRVVMGFCLDSCKEDASGQIEVRGKNVAAWTEVYLESRGWTRYKPTPDKHKTAPQPEKQKATQPQDADQPPPPPPVTRPLAEPPTSKSRTHKRNSDNASAFGIPVAAIAKAGLVLSPLWITGLIAGAIILMKRRRRERRRSAGTGRDRIAGGWAEVSDLAVDLGRPSPRQATRREAATLLGAPEAGRVADLADAAVFGPSQPSEDTVSGFWSEVDSARVALLAPLGRVQRIRASINPSSLRTRRRPPVRPARRPPVKKDTTA